MLSAAACVLGGVLPLTLKMRALLCHFLFDQMPLLISAALMRLRATLTFITLADDFLTLK